MIQEQAASPETRKAVATALTFVDDAPCWELTAPEIVYPVTLEDEGVDYTVYCHLSPYRSYELKKVLAEVSGGFRVAGKEIELGVDNDSAFKPLCDAHFLRFYGVDNDSPEAHKAYMDDHPLLKIRIAKEGFGGVTLDYANDTAASKTFSIGKVADLIRIPTKQELYSPERDLEVEVKMIHVLSRISEAHSRKHEQAMRRKVNIRSGDWWTDPNFDVIEGLYKELVDRAEGFLFDGVPCTAENKEAWVPALPLWHKILVVNEAMRLKK